MKNKILLSSVTLLSVLMVAACGNGEKKTAEPAAAPTTEVTTVAPTTTAPTTTASASSTEKKVSFSDGKYLYEWVFQKGEKVYDVALEGTADTINTLRPFLEQSFGLDPNTPGK